MIHFPLLCFNATVKTKKKTYTMIYHRSNMTIFRHWDTTKLPTTLHPRFIGGQLLLKHVTDSDKM